MIDWKRKLTSRKFWVAIVAFITPLLLAFGVAENVVTQVVALLMAGADVVAYILAEGMTDVASLENPGGYIPTSTEVLDEYSQ